MMMTDEDREMIAEEMADKRKRRVTTTQSYIPGVTCPACEDNDLRPAQARNAYSRYAEHYICSACGTREAFEAFFWRRNALKRGIAMNEAGQHEHAKAKA